MSIFLFIGAAAIGILRAGLSTWRTGETRRETLETAQMVLSQVGQDLRSMYTREFLEGQSADIRLLCDRDSNGRQRIRFVRTLAGAISPFAHKEAGSLLGAGSELDLVNDHAEARMGDLRASSGMCEIAYTMAPDPASTTLCRGLRAPIGGAGTFFDDANLAISGSGTSPSGAGAGLIEFADGILYLGFHLWTQYTNTWDAKYLPVIQSESRQKSGPALWWDSTRAYQEPFTPEEGEFTTYVSGTSLLDPRDDIFPYAIQIVLVVEEGEVGAITRLAGSIDDTAVRIPVENPNVFRELADDPRLRYVKIGGEWIRYAEVTRDGLILENDSGRGARGTIPAMHKRGDLVQAGRTFSLIVWLSSGREDWNGW